MNQVPEKPEVGDVLIPLNPGAVTIEVGRGDMVSDAPADHCVVQAADNGTVAVQCWIGDIIEWEEEYPVQRFWELWDY